MSDLELTPHASGVIIPIYAQPGARRNGVVGLHLGRLKVAVTAAPEKGKANAAVADVLADLFGLAKSRVALVSGETHREKRFLLEGVTVAAVTETIQRALPENR